MEQVVIDQSYLMILMISITGGLTTMICVMAVFIVKYIINNFKEELLETRNIANNTRELLSDHVEKHHTRAK